MANGLQARSKPNGATDTNLFVATTPIVVTLNICNLNTSGAEEAYVSVVPSGDAAGQAHLIENSTDVAAKGVIERTGIVLAAGDAIIVKSAAGNLSFNVWGVEL